MTTTTMDKIKKLQRKRFCIPLAGLFVLVAVTVGIYLFALHDPRRHSKTVSTTQFVKISDDTYKFCLPVGYSIADSQKKCLTTRQDFTAVQITGIDGGAISWISHATHPSGTTCRYIDNHFQLSQCIALGLNPSDTTSMISTLDAGVYAGTFKAAGPAPAWMSFHMDAAKYNELADFNAVTETCNQFLGETVQYTTGGYWDAYLDGHTLKARFQFALYILSPRMLLIAPLAGLVASLLVVLLKVKCYKKRMAKLLAEQAEENDMEMAVVLSQAEAEQEQAATPSPAPAPAPIPAMPMQQPFYYVAPNFVPNAGAASPYGMPYMAFVQAPLPNKD